MALAGRGSDSQWWPSGSGTASRRAIAPLMTRALISAGGASQSGAVPHLEWLAPLPACLPERGPSKQVGDDPHDDQRSLSRVVVWPAWRVLPAARTLAQTTDLTEWSAQRLGKSHRKPQYSGVFTEFLPKKLWKQHTCDLNMVTFFLDRGHKAPTKRQTLREKGTQSYGTL